MPRGDRTGPEGMGPMTGRGAGFCAGYEAPGYLNPMAGSGLGRRGRAGGRRGWRHRFNASGFGEMRRGGYSDSEAPVQSYSAPSSESPASQVAAGDRDVNALKDRLQNVESLLTELKSKIDELAHG